MTDHTESAERFARETAGHQMTVLHDDGLYRHLRFVAPRPGHSFYWFELITAPKVLIFRGDGESFTFSRLNDMFSFFRLSTWGMRRGQIEINPQYWSEKLESDRDSVMTYSKKLFDEEVASDLKAAEPIWPGVTKAWNEHANDFLSEFNTEYEEEARRALDEFEFGVKHKAHCSKCGEGETFTAHTDASLWAGRHRREHGSAHVVSVDKVGFYFTDTWEWQLKDYGWWYLWACHAIVWGIRRYDKVRGYGLQRLAAPVPAREAVAA